MLAQNCRRARERLYGKAFEELQKDIAAFALPLNVRRGLGDDMANTA